MEADFCLIFQSEKIRQERFTHLDESADGNPLSNIKTSFLFYHADYGSISH